MLTEVTRHNFDSEVLESTLPVLVCFSASSCRPCLPSCVIINDLAKNYDATVKFVMIDVETERELATRYSVLAIPTVLLFQHGKPMRILRGFHPRPYLKKALNALVADSERTQ